MASAEGKQPVEAGAPQPGKPYELTITQEPHYLHAIIRGANSAETVAAYLQELLRICVNRACSRLLIEERLEGPRLRIVPVFQIASRGTEDARTHFKAIAYVDANAAGDLMRFAETVAVNRGLPVAVFPCVDEARAWLIKSVCESAEKA